MVHFSPKFKCAVVCDDAKLKPSKNRFEPEASQVLIPFTSWGSQRHKPSVVLPKRALQKRRLTHETELCLGLGKQELPPRRRSFSTELCTWIYVFHYVDVCYKICFDGKMYLWPILEIHHLYCWCYSFSKLPYLCSISLNPESLFGTLSLLHARIIVINQHPYFQKCLF